MTEQRRAELISLEGCTVSVALSDGSRLDDCDLVSVGRHPVDSMWLFTNGVDIFVSVRNVIELWERPFRRNTPPR